MPSVVIFPDPRRDRRRIADQRGAGAAAHQTDAGPEIGADLELVAAAAMQLRHALLADRIHPREDLLRRGDGFVGDMLISSSAAFQASSSVSRTITCRRMPKRSLRPRLAASRARRGRSSRATSRRRLAPGQIFVDGVGGDIDAGVRRAAEIQRRSRRLHRREQQASVLDVDVLALEVDGLRRRAKSL